MVHKQSVPFDKKKEIKQFGEFLKEMVRHGVVFTVESTHSHFIVYLTGGY
jgi:hypothetical protein